MAGRFELMIMVTGIMTLAFMLACISTGTDNWMNMEQTGKGATIVFVRAEQGLFDRCLKIKYRSRQRSSNCYSLIDGYNGIKMTGWERAVVGLMVTSAVIMGLVVLLSGYLMISDQPRSGLLSDACPVIIGNIAAILAVIALTIYNTKYEELRKRLVGPVTVTFSDEAVGFGYSFYVGWLSAFMHFFNIFFFFIFRAWVKHSKEEQKRKAQKFSMMARNA